MKAGTAKTVGLPYRWSQRLVRKVPPLRRWFWVPEGCAPDLPSLTRAGDFHLAARAVSLEILQSPPRTEPIGDPNDQSPLYVARLTPGKVIGDGLLVATEADWVVGDVQGLHGAEDPTNHWLLRRCRYRPSVSVPGTTALLAAGAGANYYHWLFDSLPRLHLLELAGHQRREIDQFLVSEAYPQFQAQTLDLLGIPQEKRRPGRKAGVLHCERLLVPAQPSPVMVFPSWALSFLRRSFLPAAEPAPEGQRLFISRRKAARRRAANEAEVEGCLRQAGFKAVCLEGCSVALQVGLFASASAIVAVHGAGLANLAFARPGTKVIELVAPTFINHCYLKLAKAMQLSYCEVVGELAGAARKRSEEDDFCVPLAALRRALEQVGL